MTSDEQGTQVDPREFVRSVLHIAPEDAEKVREATPGTRKPKQDDEDLPRGQHGPTADYGESGEV